MQALVPVVRSDFEAEEGIWDFVVQLDDENQGKFMNYLTGHGLLTSFHEVIPSVNDIFIQTVQKQGVHA
jgi:ABC-type uncharacterized transport system ATPase subunit